MKKTPAFLEYLEYRRRKGIQKSFYNFPQNFITSAFSTRILSDMPCAFAVLDYQTLKFVWISRGVAHLTGYSKKELQKGGLKFWINLIHPKDAEYILDQNFAKIQRIVQHLAEKRIQEKTFSFSYRIKRKNGEWISILQNSVYLEVDDDKNPILLLASISDITEFKCDKRHVLSVSGTGKTVQSKLISKARVHKKEISSREIEIVKMIAHGMTTRQIAGKLFLSEHTVKTHRKNIFKKTGCENSPDLIRYAIQNDLV